MAGSASGGAAPSRACTLRPAACSPRGGIGKIRRSTLDPQDNGRRSRAHRCGGLGSRTPCAWCRPARQPAPLWAPARRPAPPRPRRSPPPCQPLRQGGPGPHRLRLCQSIQVRPACGGGGPHPTPPHHHHPQPPHKEPPCPLLPRQTGCMLHAKCMLCVAALRRLSWQNPAGATAAPQAVAETRRVARSAPSEFAPPPRSQPAASAEAQQARPAPPT